ncbi:MAG: hypothetical protein EA423_10470 [Phycisphaerales bacterium]|nr:MAG: hypothetical protein EA423_10470 [Phycisphaerales bacterium]
MLRRSLLAATVSLPLALANAQPAPDYDFQWSTIGDTNNPAFDGGGYGFFAGRGVVNYEYRISKLQITSGQWLEFANTFSMREGGRLFTMPYQWGAYLDPHYNGPGERWVPKNLPNWDMLPVAGVSWREAAMYANWLHNDKSSEQWAIENGAYDTSTFSTDPNTLVFTDQLTRNPDAKFWIPSLDEWLKAAHYDPHRHGQGEGGWWLYPNSTDEPLTPGPPGIGQTTADWIDPDIQAGEWLIPLGAYPDEASPWGLLDISGGASEWSEEHLEHRSRFFNGSNAGTTSLMRDHAGYPATSFPHTRWHHGLRIASVVPAPSTSVLLVVTLTPVVLKRKRFHHD